MATQGARNEPGSQISRSEAMSVTEFKPLEQTFSPGRKMFSFKILSDFYRHMQQHCSNKTHIHHNVEGCKEVMKKLVKVYFKEYKKLSIWGKVVE